MHQPILFDLRGGALGDEICAEPCIRYVLNMAIKYDIAVLCKYPDVFSHLNIPVFTKDEEINFEKVLTVNASPYMSFEGKMSVHPFSHYVQPLLSHAADFSSFFLLKRSLSDEEKRPVVKFDKDSLIKVKNLVPQIEKTIGIHIGATEKCRAFTKSYAQNLVDSLCKKGYSVAIFGRKTEYMPEVSCTLNLVDKLDIPMLFAFISKAPLIITNDSAPVHISAAFDNYLIVLPTIRHPDRLLHIRNKSKYYKAFALYKKLMLDDSKIPLETTLLGWDWSEAEDHIEDYLPDIKEIESIVEKIKNKKRGLLNDKL